MLETKIKEYFPRLKKNQETGLERLGIESVGDLLYHFPVRYGSIAEAVPISDLEDGKSVVLFGNVENLKTGKTFRGRKAKAEGILIDQTGKIKLTWFNQPYIAKMLEDGQLVKVSGKVSMYKDQPTLINPEIEKISSTPDEIEGSLFGEKSGGDSTETERFHPVYSESRGITSLWMHHSIQKILADESLEEIEDPIPENVRQKYNLPSIKTALIWIHNPRKESDALSARKRFAFEEIFMIQVKMQQLRHQNMQNDSFKIDVDDEKMQNFIEKFGFDLTGSQKSAISDILSDFQKGYPMTRLLEGDVGSGKTAVAAAITYATVMNQPSGQNFGNLEVAYMVPTEILAKQQFENFIEFFKGSGIKIGLITGSGCYKFPSKVNPSEATKISRAQLTKWVANGEIPIVVGTHALIQKSIEFKNLALVIIDEQHRFGTNQRLKLAKKDGHFPHLLSMTATPIPRTLALTIYGDLDLTLLDEMPAGRKPVETEIVLPENRDNIYEQIREQLSAGKQAYVICPRIDEPDPTKVSALRVKSVKKEAARLRKEIFPKNKIEILHSKMKTAEKEDVMNEFATGKIDILVSTSVVEVGVNVPNATTIVIEGAERFGLAQLHQLRGRVLRSNDQAYCYIFTDSKNESSLKRLEALSNAKNGFELAEHDLKIRGAGDLSGKKQWGITDLAMEAIQNIQMVEAAQKEAAEIIKKDAELKWFDGLRQKIDAKEIIHFE